MLIGSAWTLTFLTVVAFAVASYWKRLWAFQTERYRLQRQLQYVKREYQMQRLSSHAGDSPMPGAASLNGDFPLHGDWFEGGRYPGGGRAMSTARNHPVLPCEVEEVPGSPVEGRAFEVIIPAVPQSKALSSRLDGDGRPVGNEMVSVGAERDGGTDGADLAAIPQSLPSVIQPTVPSVSGKQRSRLTGGAEPVEGGAAVRSSDGRDGIRYEGRSHRRPVGGVGAIGAGQIPIDSPSANGALTKVADMVREGEVDGQTTAGVAIVEASSEVPPLEESKRGVGEVSGRGKVRGEGGVPYLKRGGMTHEEWRDRVDEELRGWPLVWQTGAVCGQAYEDYVAYLLNKEGWVVEHRGAMLGLGDGGLDLIAWKGKRVLLIQCKCWSTRYELREKVVHQLHGSAGEWRIAHSSTLEGCEVEVQVVTTTTLSVEAQRAASVLGVVVRQVAFGREERKYPRVKLVDSVNGKVYHPPCSAYYHTIRRPVGYIHSCREAEALGYRPMKRVSVAADSTEGGLAGVPTRGYRDLERLKVYSAMVDPTER